MTKLIYGEKTYTVEDQTAGQIVATIKGCLATPPHIGGLVLNTIEAGQCFFVVSAGVPISVQEN